MGVSEPIANATKNRESENPKILPKNEIRIDDGDKELFE